MIIGIILNHLCAVLTDILCTMGLPSVDESLNKLLEVMSAMPKSLGTTQGIATTVGACIALGIGSYEAWMMMLGRRGMDVMKILRIVILSICITQSGLICSALGAPGAHLESEAKSEAEAQFRLVAGLEKKVAQKQADYLNRLRAVQDSIAKAQKVEAIGEDADWWDEIIYTVSTMGQTIENLAQRAAVATETKISEWINDIIRFLGMLVFQMAYYGMLVAQRCFMAIVQSFCPLFFALSLAPPWRSAWSQWIGKYVSLSLWGWVTYTIIYYVGFILTYNLEADITAYDGLLKGHVDSWENIGALGLQGIGSNCMYAMGMLVGFYVLKFVPEVASWLMPGGVSSGMGQAAGGTVQQIANGAAGFAVGHARAAAGTAGGWANNSLHSGIHDPQFGAKFNKANSSK